MPTPGPIRCMLHDVNSHISEHPSATELAYAGELRLFIADRGIGRHSLGLTQIARVVAEQAQLWRRIARLELVETDRNSRRKKARAFVNKTRISCGRISVGNRS